MEIALIISVITNSILLWFYLDTAGDYDAERSKVKILENILKVERDKNKS